MRVKRSVCVCLLVLTLIASLITDNTVVGKVKYPAIKHAKTMKLKVGATGKIKLKVRTDCKVLTTKYTITKGKGIVKAGKKKGTFIGKTPGTATVKIRVTYYIGMYTFKTYTGTMTIKVQAKKPKPTPVPTPTSTPDVVSGSAVEIV